MGTLTDYNAAKAKVEELKTQLAEAEKAVEDALPTVRIRGDHCSIVYRLNGSTIETIDDGSSWKQRGYAPNTLDQLRAMADAFLPERARKEEERYAWLLKDDGGCLRGTIYDSELDAWKAQAWRATHSRPWPYCTAVRFAETNDAQATVWAVRSCGGSYRDRYGTKEEAIRVLSAWDKNWGAGEPHRVVGLVEVEG